MSTYCCCRGRPLNRSHWYSGTERWTLYGVGVRQTSDGRERQHETFQCRMYSAAATRMFCVLYCIFFVSSHYSTPAQCWAQDLAYVKTNTCLSPACTVFKLNNNYFDACSFEYTSGIIISTAFFEKWCLLNEYCYVSFAELYLQHLQVQYLHNTDS